MEETTAYLTQSRYYSPAFDAAIFDGPIRIYFAQYQEPIALKVYFRLQNCLKETFEQLKESSVGRQVYLMLYPSSESFYMSFDKSHESSEGETLVVEEPLGDDIVVGVRDIDEDGDFENIQARIKAILSSFPQSTQEEAWS